MLELNSFTVLAVLHGVFYFLTGVWPLLSIDSFQRVTGPKRDLWLVQTVGVVIAVIGVTLTVAGFRNAPSVEVVVLAVGAALALAAVDVIFVSLRQISPIYLADAAAEVLLAAGWVGILVTSPAGRFA